MMFSSLVSSRYISIHALREEGDLGTGAKMFIIAGISIHALREEGDHSRMPRLFD